ncbi:MAG: hypothetical protein M1383_05610 [Patescibacteria group bacterium]|nr:hypothetical protein [Patescibacteria group bacterium]
MSNNWLKNRLILFAKIDFLWLSGLVLNIITFLIIFYKINPGGRPLALHYDVLVGVDWYGKGRNLYLIPFAGLAVLIINFILYRSLKNIASFLAFLSGFVSVGIQLVLLLAVILLSRIN